MRRASGGDRPEGRFSGRIRWELEENELTRAFAEKRRAGVRVWDLTASNPTRAGFPYPAEDILAALASPEALSYDPTPRGLYRAREAVARYYRERGADLEADDLFLASSTSEAYSLLFKLLCDPEDEILVPRPSYPLFDFLAFLDAVRPVPYPLRYDGSWHVDFPSLESAISSRTRGVVLVHPGNPTGAYASSGDRERLESLCAAGEIPLIVDEVFLDFPLETKERPRSFAASSSGLTFVTSGLSKVAALPQMKLAWIAVGGDPVLAREASSRLEHIEDTYLSVSTPVSVAASRLLELAPAMVRLVSERTRRNLDTLRDSIRRVPAVTVPVVEGGWYAILRLPAILDSEEWALELLVDSSVLVHPGNFFGLEEGATLVVSLLPEPEIFRDGLSLLLRKVSARMSRQNG